VLDDEVLGGARWSKQNDFLVFKENSTLDSWSLWSTDMIERIRDPRVDGWLLMDSPWGTVGLCLAYLSIILYFGPRFMQNRAAYSMKVPMLLYNLLQTVMCTGIFIIGARSWYSGMNKNLFCKPVDYSNSKQSLVALSMSWWYFFSKFIDFFDSFFFILRKKNNQLSTLHIIHHSTMPIFSWTGPKFAGGGNTLFGGTVNMFVHVVMYFYYFLAALGVRKEFLWWKKYLTSMQMIQFMTVIVHSTFPLVMQDCQYPKEMCYIFLFNAAMYLGLFYNFYQSEYKKASKNKQQ